MHTDSPVLPLHTDSPVLPLQLNKLMHSDEGKCFAQQGIAPITWLGGGGCAQVCMRQYLYQAANVHVLSRLATN